MTQYFEDLFKQIRELPIEASDSIQLTANDGEPAILQVRTHNKIKLYVQNEDLSKLNLELTRKI